MVTYNDMLVTPLYGRAGCCIAKVGSGHETRISLVPLFHIESDKIVGGRDKNGLVYIPLFYYD